MKADEFLKEAIRQMEERAKLRDQPEGERSMEMIVDTFNSLTDHDMTEFDGWLFMLVLKIVRAKGGQMDIDSFVDMAAYASLAGECKARMANIKTG